MNEGQFLKMPNGQEGNNFVRKHAHLSEEKYVNMIEDWEKRTILYSNSEVEKFFVKYELKMTPRHKEIFKFVVERVNDFLEEYAPEGPRASMDQLRMAKRDLFKFFNSPDSDAMYFSQLQTIAINADKNVTSTNLADSAFHEFMHYFSFQRSVLKGGKSDGYPNIEEERLGLAIVSKENPNYRYYREINEAITVELSRRFWVKMRENKLFQDDIWKLKQKYGTNTEWSVLRMNKNPDGSLEPESIMGYYPQYLKTNATMREIYEKNKTDFNSPEDVTEMFIKAYFSGRLLPVARLIEKTYGKGKFRAIGEESGF